MKIRPVGSKLFHADGQSNRHDKSNRRFFHNAANAPKKLVTPTNYKT